MIGRRAVALASWLLCTIGGIPISAQTAPPAAPKREVADTYFGTVITDPYRWMEPPVGKNPEFMDWLKQQNAGKQCGWQA